VGLKPNSVHSIAIFLRSHPVSSQMIVLLNEKVGEKDWFFEILLSSLSSKRSGFGLLFLWSLVIISSSSRQGWCSGTRVVFAQRCRYTCFCGQESLRLPSFTKSPCLWEREAKKIGADGGGGGIGEKKEDEEEEEERKKGLVSSDVSNKLYLNLEWQYKWQQVVLLKLKVFSFWYHPFVKSNQ